MKTKNQLLKDLRENGEMDSFYGYLGNKFDTNNINETIMFNCFLNWKILKILERIERLSYPKQKTRGEKIKLNEKKSDRTNAK